LLIPTRPPAEFWVEPPEEQDITRAYFLFKQFVTHVTLLIDFPDDAFPVTSHLEEEILSLTSVHPLRRQDMELMIRKAKSEFSMVDKLIKEDKLIQTEYQGDTFYIRKFSNQIRV
jgi:wyosine [tRNA(Phe)-imidazoG37] synthetase (radical SAM superfamily)